MDVAALRNIAGCKRTEAVKDEGQKHKKHN